MPVAELTNGKIVLQSEFREKELIKLLPGVKWSTEEQTWWVALSWAACMQMRGIFGGSLQVGPELAAWSRNERGSRVAPCMELRTADDASPEMVSLLEEKGF
jgi:hypothetical protein